MSCTKPKLKRSSVAPFTVSKMQATQLLMALTLPVTQETDFYICGSHFQNSWHLAEDERINCDPENVESLHRLMEV